MTRAEKGQLTSELQSLKTCRLQPTILRRKGKSDMFEVDKGMNIEAVAKRLKTSDSHCGKANLNGEDESQFCQKVTVEALPVRFSPACISDTTRSSLAPVEPSIVVVVPVMEPDSVPLVNSEERVDQNRVAAKLDTEENVTCDDVGQCEVEQSEKSTEKTVKHMSCSAKVVQAVDPGEDNNFNQEKEKPSSPAEQKMESSTGIDVIPKETKNDPDSVRTCNSKGKAAVADLQSNQEETELGNKMNKVKTGLQSNQVAEDEPSNKTHKVGEKEKQAPVPKPTPDSSLSSTSSPMYPKKKRKVAVVAAAASSVYYKDWIGNSPSPILSRRRIPLTPSPTENPRNRKPIKRCKHCNIKFVRTSILYEHQRSVHGIKRARPKPYKCYDCSKCFESRLALTDHENTHSGE